MAREYLDELSELISNISPQTDGVEFETKHFFSGAALYANGKICVTLTPVGLAIKLPEAQIEKLLKEKKAKPLRYFPKAPIKKEYVVVAENIKEDKTLLRNLIEESIEYVTR